MTTPTDYPDRVRALLEAATPGPWQVMPDARARVKLDHVESGYGSPAGVGSPVCSIPRARAGDAELCAEAPTLARAYLDLHAEVERLTRVLADRAAGGAA